jgi:hypothetical protein
VNDFYYANPPYNTADEMRSVLCEELGHTIGLDHPEPGTTGGCVMGYADDKPIVSPSAHDYQMIESHYAITDQHKDKTTTVGTTTAVAARDETEIDASKWGRVLKLDDRGRPSVYGKEVAPGQMVTTFVVYPDNAEAPTANDGGGTGDGGQNDDGQNGGGKRDGGKKDSKRDGGKKDGGKRHR